LRYQGESNPYPKSDNLRFLPLNYGIKYFSHYFKEHHKGKESSSRFQKF
jgi:hypothetical protein